MTKVVSTNVNTAQEYQDVLERVYLLPTDAELQDLQGDVGTLQGDVGTLQGDVGTLQGDVGTLAAIVPNTLGNQLDGSPAYEDFDRPEGFLVSGMTTKSGDPFTISGPGGATAFISGNALSNAGGGNFYATPGTSPTLLTEAWGVVSFSPVGTDAPVQGPQAVIMFTDDGATGLNGGLLHLEITPNNPTMKATITGATNLVTLSGTAKYSHGNEGYKKIPIDGSLHRVGLSYIRKATALEDILIAHLPFGRSIEYKGDTKIRAVMDGAYWANWQIITPTAANDGWQPKWHGMAYGQRRSRVPALLAGAPNESDYARLLGKTGGNGDNIKSRIRIDPTAVGWYAIATGVSLSFNLIGGDITFSGQSNSGRKSKCSISLGWESGRNLVVNNIDFPVGRWTGTTQISKFRISSASSSGGYQLDVHIDEVINNLDFVVIDLEGYFTPVLSPVVGATPLANASYERKVNLTDTFDVTTTGNATRTLTPGLSPTNMYLPDSTAPSQRLILVNTVALESDTFHFVRPSSASNSWVLENSSDSVAFHTISSGTWCDVAIKSGKFIVVRQGSL
jgi:hypothetical protein